MTVTSEGSPPAASMPASVGQKPKFTHLVLDSAPLLQGCQFPRTLSESYWTVPEVLAELKDRAAIDSLARLPFRLQVRQPSVEAVRLVQTFAKDSGDAAVLSATDIKVLALTACLEMESNDAASRMRRTPIPPQTHQNAPGASMKAKEATEAAREEKEGGAPAACTTQDDSDESGGEWITPDNVDQFKAKDKPSAWSANTCPLPAAAATHASIAVPKRKVVACMTADFAMQNVLLQMRLQLYAPDGRRIRRLKNWLLRCYACFATTKQMDRKFCPQCGSPTLMRTSYAVDGNGQTHLYLRANFQYNNRGTKYSIPLPKGGRNADNLILREDQIEHQRAMKAYQRHEKKAAKAQATIDDLDDRLVAVFGGLDLGSAAAFAPSKKALAAFEPVSPPTIGYGRRNPNQSRRTPK